MIRQKKKSRQQIWQDKRQDAGCCICCGKKKPDGRDQGLCRPCTVRQSTRAIARYHENPEQQKKQQERCRKYGKEQREARSECRQILKELNEKEATRVNR